MKKYSGKRYNKHFLWYRRFYYKRYWTDVERKEFNESLNYDYTRYNVERISPLSNWRVRVIGHYSEFIARVNRKMRKTYG